MLLHMRKSIILLIALLQSLYAGLKVQLDGAFRSRGGGTIVRHLFTIHRLGEARGQQNGVEQDRLIDFPEIQRAMHHAPGYKDNGGLINQVRLLLFTDAEIHFRLKRAEQVRELPAEENKVFIDVMRMGFSFQVDRLNKQLPAHVKVSAGNLAGAAEISLRTGHSRQVGRLFKVGKKEFIVFSFSH